MPRCRRWVTTRRKGYVRSSSPSTRRAVVARAVVHDHDLEREAGRAQGLGAESHELGKIGRLVLGRDEHADVQRSAAGGHTRFRIRAGRMPSWSRYLATVRRAI